MNESREKIDASQLDLKDTVVNISRVTKVVKGGKNLSFSALVVVGDGHGVVGFGIGKAKEVPSAIKKGIEAAKKNLVRVPLAGNTIPHAIVGNFGAGSVLLKPAPDGTGIIAGGGVRAVVESCGISNVLTKSIGSANPHNVVRATFAGLRSLKEPSLVARLRGKELEELVGAGQVLLKPAPDGTGIIAGGAVRAVVESAGIQNVLTKSIGSANHHNVVRATFQGLMELREPGNVLKLRGREVESAETR